STAVGAGGDFNILDCRQSSVENYCRSLWPAAVGIHAGVLAGIRTRAVILLLRGAAKSGTDARHRSQLPGTSVQHRARGASAGGVSASNADGRNYSGAG